jgi:hypothetical protein
MFTVVAQGPRLKSSAGESPGLRRVAAAMPR